MHYFAVDKLVEHIQNSSTPLSAVTGSHGSLQPVQREDALEMVMQEVESLLRSLPEYVLQLGQIICQTQTHGDVVLEWISQIILLHL